MSTNPARPDEHYLHRRIRQETRAALRCDNAKAAAAHVELANRYLRQLNAHSPT